MSQLRSRLCSPQPAPGDDDASEPNSTSPRPTLTIDTSTSPSPRSHSPSPTSAGGTLRFFGPRSPRSAPSSFSSLHRDYFGGGALSPTLTPAERERERAQRKAREDAEREAKERELDLRAWQKEKRRRRKAREKELKRRRVFIKEHVAAILERQNFILKLARAFMMFGAPSHRLEAQIQATARVLELPHCSAMYLPGVLLVNFGDPATCTSDIKVRLPPLGLTPFLPQALTLFRRVRPSAVPEAGRGTRPRQTQGRVLRLQQGDQGQALGRRRRGPARRPHDVAAKIRPAQEHRRRRSCGSVHHAVRLLRLVHRLPRRHPAWRAPRHRPGPPRAQRHVLELVRVRLSFSLALLLSSSSCRCSTRSCAGSSSRASTP